MQLPAISALLFVLSVGVSAVPMRERRAADAATQTANGQQATSENNNFKSLTATSSCTAGQDACVNDQFAQCVGGKFVLQACGPGTVCASLPLVNSKGTSITCTTAADRDARIAAATGGSAAGVVQRRASAGAESRGGPRVRAPAAEGRGGAV
ncbi:hypothetical protein EWM64_g5001 [Hericium alpestre]|uniref:Carbohydrate-binding module family 19 domain-containing protein n=1 Tax=Hericium alpestre TaxID=135208 RepID=A0A4Y9ZZY2_9AGAM|nr:hypothetical protein EWM64_g5001 [Hericium alpestre]